MRTITVRRLRRLIPAVLTAIAAVSMPSAAQAGCAGANSSPAALGAQTTRTTTLCVLNAKRHAHGLRPLRLGKKLARAARRHSRDMVAHTYFSHNSRSGVGFTTRIARTGWMHGKHSWTVGENLAWGGGARSTPRKIVKSWMASADHRKNILRRGFHEIGIGVAEGVPVAGAGSGATYTTDFGS